MSFAIGSNESEFLIENNWHPNSLEVLAHRIHEKFIDSNDRFKIDVITTIESLSKVMELELSSGINKFYSKVSEVVTRGPIATWKFMEAFTQNIVGVRAGLMSDFLKNIGFPEFVKIDQRLKKEFPKLVKELPHNPKKMFVCAWHLCEQLKMTPFVFDHILYQWGNPRLKALLK